MSDQTPGPTPGQGQNPTPSANPMPGWYPDPEAPERQRFWDGTKWTEARAYPVAGATPGAAGAVPPPTSEPVPDEKRKSNPWIIIALIAIIAAVLFALAWFFLLRDQGTDVEPLVPPGSPPATALPSPATTPGGATGATAPTPTLPTPTPTPTPATP